MDISNEKTAFGCTSQRTIARKRSFEAFKHAGLEATDVTEHLTTDAGDGAGLPNLEPKLKENGTLPDHGRGCNCQYHGHNKGYENASTAAFGSQGLEKANIFQAGYQYSVLVKAIKEDVGLKVLAEIREIVLMNLLKSKKLQEEVKKNNHKAFDELVDLLLKKDIPDSSEVALDLEAMIQSLRKIRSCCETWLRKIHSSLIFFDKSTWPDGKDCTSIIDVVHKRIAIHHPPTELRVARPNGGVRCVN